MSLAVTLATAAALLALAAVLGVLLAHRRQRAAYDTLARSIHDHARDLDRRCDALQAALDRLALAQRVDHLDALVAGGRRRGLLSRAAAERLGDAVLALRRDARAPAR